MTPETSVEHLGAGEPRRHPTDRVAACEEILLALLAQRWFGK